MVDEKYMCLHKVKGESILKLGWRHCLACRLTTTGWLVLGEKEKERESVCRFANVEWIAYCVCSAAGWMQRWLIWMRLFWAYQVAFRFDGVIDHRMFSLPFRGQGLLHEAPRLERHSFAWTFEIDCQGCHSILRNGFSLNKGLIRLFRVTHKPPADLHGTDWSDARSNYNFSVIIRRVSCASFRPIDIIHIKMEAQVIKSEAIVAFYSPAGSVSLTINC